MKKARKKRLAIVSQQARERLKKRLWIYGPHFYVQVYHCKRDGYQRFVFGVRGSTLKDAVNMTNNRLKEEWLRLWPKKAKRT